MSSIVLAISLGTILYLVVEIIAIFGGAMFFTWLVVLCVRKWFKMDPPRDTIRHQETPEKPAAVIELRLLVETTKEATEDLREEQARLRIENEESGD